MSREPPGIRSFPARADMSITAIVPAFNAERYVAEAVASVLRQSLPPESCVVVDDGSTDGTALAVRWFGGGISLISQPNRGVAAARNAGAQAAGGDFLAFLDADDVWLPNHLATTSQALADPDMDVVVGTALEAADSLTRRPAVHRLDSQHPLARGLMLFDRRTATPAAGSTMVIRRSLFERLGGFDERLSTSADLDLLVRAAITGRVTMVREPHVLYRRNPSSMSSNIPRQEQDLLAMYEKVGSEVLGEDMGRGQALLHAMLARSYARRGSLGRAATHLGQALRLAPITTASSFRKPARG